MLKKSYVSVSFASPKKIHVLKLSSSKKDVRKHISVDLPEGLIKDLRVVNEQALAKMLKEIWRKAGLREKSVGIVIPESSTYTKLLSLPKLPYSELDEAVRWQVLEYLPHKAKDLILDWKIVKEDTEKVSVLVVAVLKEILQGYVNSAHLADLYPLVVENPSLSLVRFVAEVGKDTLFVYQSSGETIVLISQEQSIIGSSVVNIGNPDEVVRVAEQMLKHFSEVKVEQIVIGGNQVDNQLSSKLSQTFGLQPLWIKPTVSGVDTNMFQEYMIPISLQLKDPAEPEATTTVNLLPPELVKKYLNEKLKGQIWSLSLLVTLFVWISFFSVLGLYLFFGMQIGNLKQEGLLNKIPKEKAQYIEQVEQINAVSEKTLDITKAKIYPQTIFNAISDAKPEGVSILRYRVDMEMGAIELIGISPTRESLINFKNKLEENEDFSLVTIPISNFEAESNLNYTMSFRYLPLTSTKGG